MTLHTDGTYVMARTDWILMMKMEEHNALGGESRLLHLDDWEDLEKFANHTLASVPFVYQAPPSKNYPMKVEKTAFYDRENEFLVDPQVLVDRTQTLKEHSHTQCNTNRDL